MIERLRLHSGDWQRMRTHVHGCKPLEGCGLLAGRGDTVERVVAVTNAAHSASRFRLEPSEQLRAFQEIEDEGLDLLGIFHSHPADRKDGTAALEAPSETDVREAAYPVVHVIWSQRSGVWQARGFWIEASRIQDVPLVVLPIE